MHSFDTMDGMSTKEQDFAIEERLSELSPWLYKRYRDCFVISGRMLTRYENYFPDFTDHSRLHTMDILDLCSRLIGSQLDKLSAEDLYVLLMGALFHDVGMGVSYSDFEEFRKILGIAVPEDDTKRAWAVRDYHQELSALFLEKYYRILDFPNEKYLKAVVQVCRGHRKRDLMNEEEYPPLFEVEDGKTVYLPYLAALICLADELDISQDRNISFVYDVDSMPNEKDRTEFRKHMAVYSVELEEERVVVRAKTDDEKIRKGVEEVCTKLQGKLLSCRKAAAERSPFTIPQKEVVLLFDEGE